MRRELSAEMSAARIKHVDGLRALAVLSVLLYHATKTLPNSAWFSQGRHGVDLFFVISGFCLSYPVVSSIARSGTAGLDIPSFFAKRVVRIVPPYFAAIVAFAVLTVALLAIRAPLPEMITAISPLDILKQFFFLDYNSNYSNGSFWTLAVEARWYLLFPLILWLWVTRRKAFWLVAALSFFTYHFTRLGGAGFLSSPPGMDFATLPAFMFGIVAAEMHVRNDSRAAYAFLAMPALLLPTWLTHGGDAVQDSLDWQLISVAVVLTVGHYRMLGQIFSWKPLAFVGVASYSIYLYHEPILGTLEHVFHVAWPAAAAASLAAGITAWYMVERRLQLSAIKNVWATELKTPFVRFFRAFDLPQETQLAGTAAVLVAPAKENSLSPQTVIKLAPQFIGESPLHVTR
ncbi:MAG TPA: acyltransferase [Candidatus Rubrimentiphilum sp.]|nr:acyltransferase [Candidatus Rubrimentiphilum sp.]